MAAIKKRQLIPLLGLILAAGPAAAANPKSPEMLGNTCAGCHGTFGASAGPSMPVIGGLDKGYLTTVMLQFKSGERPSTIMGRIAKGYSDDEIKAMADFFAGQKWVSAQIKTDSGRVAKGKAIHEDQCEKCHEEGGQSGDEDTPRVAGQWPAYTYIQLHDGRTADAFDERMPMPKKMRKRVDELSEDDIQNLADFYASQQ